MASNTTPCLQFSDSATRFHRNIKRGIRHYYHVTESCFETSGTHTLKLQFGAKRPSGWLWLTMHDGAGLAAGNYTVHRKTPHVSSSDNGCNRRLLHQDMGSHLQKNKETRGLTKKQDFSWKGTKIHVLNHWKKMSKTQ
jgi:hypothetical protein